MGSLLFDLDVIIIQFGSIVWIKRNNMGIHECFENVYECFERNFTQIIRFTMENDIF
jgi:hypothetical protein